MKTLICVVSLIIFISFLNNEVKGTSLKRISEQKCDEYHNKLDKDSCRQIKKRHISEKNLTHAEFPHVALIGHKHANGNIIWLCSGILISEEYVLTVAHCTSLRSGNAPNIIRLGETDLNDTGGDEEVQNFGISQTTRHPNYVPQTVYNDIAVLKLDKPVHITKFVRPACLYTGDDLSKYEISGWSFRTKTLDPVQVLVSSDIEVASEEDCMKEYPKRKNIPNGVNFQIQFCTRVAEPSCEINSGAPIQIYDEEKCAFYVAGVVDVAKSVCGGKTELNVKIPGVADWIESVVWP